MTKISEAFLHHVWKFRWFNGGPLKTHQGQALEILHPGFHNHHGGPDFMNARIRIDDTLWCGNVEIHVHASDWHRHNHQDDDHYKNIILHVVLYNDADIFLHVPGDLPVLNLSNAMNISIWDAHRKWLSSYEWIPCEKKIHNLDPIIWLNTSDRLQLERAEERVSAILDSLKRHAGDWTQVAFSELCKSFGFKSNSLPMEMLASSIPFSVIARHQSDPLQLDALLFGQAGLLPNEACDDYSSSLINEYRILQPKYSLTTLSSSIWNFGKVRPTNSPLLRIAQLSAALSKSNHLVSSLIHLPPYELTAWLKISPHPYWKRHKNFGMLRKTPLETSLGKASAEQVIINVACRLRFAFGKYHNDQRMMESALAILHALSPEINSITSKWAAKKIRCEHAGDSQAMIQLYSVYCTRERCFECPMGISLLQKETHETNSQLA
jgi:Protein of unknown function (DUF2851)